MTDCASLKVGSSKGVLGVLSLPMIRNPGEPFEPVLENLARTGSLRMTADGMFDLLEKVTALLTLSVQHV